MNAYLFTGLVSQYHKGQYVDACSNVILYGGEDEAASRKAFERLLLSHDNQEDAAPTTIERIVSAPVLDQLLTETGHNPINWLDLTQEVLRVLEVTPVDDQEQGYWVDCNQCIRPDKLPPGIDRLQRELPEELRSGLNWSPDKNYFFSISVISPPAVRPELLEDNEEDRLQEDEDLASSTEADFVQHQATFPQLANKELAVVVRARNSIVAAWLWRRYAATTKLAPNEVRVDALCDIVSISGNDG